MAANMKIVKIWQVYTAINISIRRYRKVSFCGDIVFCIYFFGCVGLIQVDLFTFSKINFESDPFSRVSSKCVIGVSLMSCRWLDSNSMFMKVGVIDQKDII